MLFVSRSKLGFLKSSVISWEYFLFLVVKAAMISQMKRERDSQACENCSRLFARCVTCKLGAPHCLSWTAY